MLKQEEAREEAMRIELAKIAKANPNAVPLYIILNSAKKEAPAEQPLTLCSKDSIVRDLLLKLHRKYPTYQQIYFFGKDHLLPRVIQKNEGKSKKKRREQVTGQKREDRQGQMIIPITEAMMGMTVMEAHERYHDPQGLLVVIVSDTPLILQKRKSQKELILLALTVLFAAIFLYLSLSQESVKTGGEIDYLNII